MAKRKRLTPANPVFMTEATPLGAAMRAAPIADVAREASATAAAEEMAQTLSAARESGRMVVGVPLGAIETGYLVRDRVAVDEGEMTALAESIRARGQQMPVELVDLGAGRFGLISGWRRCLALQRLHSETGEPRFAEVLGLLRRPEEASDAYRAMVDENEIRVGLSYFERARIAAKSVEQGVFETPQAALRALFSGASRAKRSKIKSFMTVVGALDGDLRFPHLLGERQGLALAQALEADGGLAGRLRDAFSGAQPEDAEAEQALIRATLAPPPAAAKPVPERAAPDCPAPGIEMTRPSSGRIVLGGKGVDEALWRDLGAWLAARGGAG